MLIWQMEKLDENLPMELEDILNKNLCNESDLTAVSHDAVKSDSMVEDRRDIPIPAETQVIVITYHLELYCWVLACSK